MRAPNSVPLSHAVAALLGPVARVVAKLRETAERRRVFHNLASLDDHMLRDIGLTRYDLEAARVQPALAGATLLLAERARDSRRSQGGVAREPQAWATPRPEVDGRGADAISRRAA